MTAEDFAWGQGAELREGFQSGAFTPVDVAAFLLDRIDQLDGWLNAFVHVDREMTLTQAKASAARWQAGEPLSALDGIPMTIKDLVPVVGWPLCRGSRAFPADPPAPEDAPCVARLREAGAVFLGKTATPDSGCKITTRSDVHGETANPWDLTKTPGGSSGGASAALAAGIGPLAVGTDGAGSIRIPASHCNLVGIKPSFGRVPINPPSLFMPHSVIGPMGRRVADVAAMLDIMSRPDPRDPYALPQTDLSDLGDTESLKGLRIAFSPDFGFTAPLMDSEVADLVAASAGIFEALGASVTEAAPVWPADPLEPFMVFWDATYAGYRDTFPDDKKPLLDPTIQAIADRGEKVDILTYHRALGQRLAMAQTAKAFFSAFDLLVGPVMPIPAYPLGAEQPPGQDHEWDWCPFTYPWNMTGQPALSVPCGFTKEGLPVGLQIIGWVGDEARVLRAGAAFEAAMPLHDRHPDF